MSHRRRYIECNTLFHPPAFQVRSALEQGDLNAVCSFLDRKYTLRLKTEHGMESEDTLFFPKSTFLNQYPRNGEYDVLIDDVLLKVAITDAGLRCPKLSTLSTSSLSRLTFI